MPHNEKRSRTGTSVYTMEEKQDEEKQDEEYIPNIERSENVAFVEFERTSKLIRSIIDAKEDFQESDEALREIRQIFDKYLELPSLLDKHIGSMVADLAGAARNIMNTDVEFWQSPLPRIFSTLYALSKVRGRKRVQKFLPHAVEDVESVLETLKKLDEEHKTKPVSTVSSNGGPQLWESIYTLWNWMGILSLVPFDSAIIVDETRISGLIHLAKLHLSEPGPIRDMASACLASWLSRPDFEEKELVSFIDWSITVLEDFAINRQDIFKTMGCLQTLVAILKVSTANREKLCTLMAPLWTIILKISGSNLSNLILRKNLIKWWTRLGSAYLPPRIASWRYKRGRRSLKENLLISNSGESQNRPASKDAMESDWNENSQSDIFSVPDQVEEAMGRVIDGLTDPSTIVRWSAAKGVGRIAERLPKICAEDVIDALLELLDDVERDNDWHGACLAFAELARRGLLLPHRFPQVIPKIAEALHYDVPRRQTSVGAHVRDAACYTYWAIARAYSPSILKPFVPQLSESVILAFLFDREVNCRRAASAAFQEFVGRQGATNVKHGISILTAADYFSLGNRIEAYTSISLHVSQFGEYRRPIIENLFRVKLRHWDKTIRTLSAQAIGKLTHLDTAFIESVAIPYLLENSLDVRNVQLRHGSVIGLAEIILAYNSLEDLLSKETMSKIAELVGIIEKKRLYRGKGGEQMREAVCRLIECISITGIPLTVTQQVRMLDSIDACLPHPAEAIQIQAGKGLHALMKAYFPVTSTGPSDRLQKRVVDKYVKQVRTNINPAYTRGFSMALGYLPAKLLAPSSKVLDIVLSTLCKASRPDAKVGNDKDAETRRNSIVTLERICATVDMIERTPSKNQCVVALTEKQVGHVYTALFRGLEDYNMERRGDVGSMSRIVAMHGLETMAKLTTRDQRTSERYFSKGICIKIIGGLLKQLAEKLDAVRSEAGSCLIRLLSQSDPSIPFIPKKDKLLMALKSDNDSSQGSNDINWSDASVTFPMVMKVADIDEYFEFVVSGLVISVGCLTQSVSKHACAVLLQWVKDATSSDIKRLGNGKNICYDTVDSLKFS